MPVPLKTGLKATLQGVAANAPDKVNGVVPKDFVQLPHEPEDANITGVTRSLHRRLLALNIGGSLRPQSAA
jgi:hypothetical protein